jgi:hypothetical protein
MKNVCLAFSLLIIHLGHSQQKQLPIKVLEATVQHWVSGAPGGRTGTKYAIKIYVRTNKKLEFVNLWLGNKSVYADIEFYSQEIQKKIDMGDSLVITYNEIDGEQHENGVRVPFSYKGAALIETKVDGKTRYFIVMKLKVLPDLHTK